MLTEAVQYLASIRNELLRLKMDHQQVLQDLAMHRVSPEILPETLYTEITHEIDAMGYVSMPLQWVYKHGQTNYLFETQGQIVYTLSIPFGELTPYLYYELHTFAMPVNNLSSMILVDTHTEIGYNTETGEVSAVESCVGEDLMICPPTPAYSGEHLQCERTIINKRQVDPAVCTIHRLPALQRTEIRRHDTGWVLTILEEELTLTCRGRPEERTLIPTGLYRLTLDSSCTLAGREWSLKGEVAARSSVNLTTTDISIDTSWIDRLPAHQDEEVDMNILPDWNVKLNISSDKLMDNWQLHDFDENDELFDDDLYDDVTNHVSVVNVVIAMIVITIIIMFAVALYRRRESIKYFLQPGQKKKNAKEEDNVTLRDVVIRGDTIEAE